MDTLISPYGGTLVNLIAASCPASRSSYTNHRHYCCVLNPAGSDYFSR